MQQFKPVQHFKSRPILSEICRPGNPADRPGATRRWRVTAPPTEGQACVQIDPLKWLDILPF